MNIYSLPKEEILKRLNTSEQGLSDLEIQSRLEQFGYNTIQTKQKKNYWKSYLLQYTQFFPVLLEIAAALSFVADHFSPNEGNDILAWAIICAVIVNATFTFWQEYRADKAMEALMKLMPSMIKARRNGQIVEVDAKNIVPGDIILVDEGDKVPVDGVLIDANSLYLNMSTLTGESKPIARIDEPTDSERELDARNLIFAGTNITSGNGIAVAYSTGSSTEFGKIAALTRDIQKGLTPMQKEIIRITRILTIIALIMGVLFFVLGFFSDKGILLSAIFALSLIVANVPEGLLPTITLSLSRASQRMARRQALVKNLDSVETLGSTSVICTDKTGTLTRNEMTLKKAFLPTGEEIEFSGDGYFAGGTYTISSERDNSRELLEFMMVSGTMNSHAEIHDENVFGDPTELAIVCANNKVDSDNSCYSKISEIPFTSERKMMSTTCERDGTKYLFAKGALEVVLELCTSYLNGDNNITELDQVAKQSILDKASDYENQAYRVLAIAYTNTEEERNLILQGIIAIMDLPREEVFDSIMSCYSAGIRIMMVTGDDPLTAKAVGEKIGLKIDSVIHGKDLKKMSDDEVKKILSEKDVHFARLESGQKLRITSLLQENGEVVAMTGDGVNDAPALRRADIGISMGKSGTEVTKEASDMVLIDDNFNSIVSAIEEGRTVYFNIKKFVTYILSSNVPEIVPYILQFFLKIPLPLSVIQILSIDLGSDLVPGLALGSEEPEANIMKRPPVGKHERILDWEVFKRGYFMNGMFEAAAAMFGFLSFLWLHGWTYGDLSITNTLLHKQAMTMTLLGAVFCQLFNVWTLRSYEFSAFSMSVTKNKTMIWAMIIELSWIFMLLYVEPVQKVFNTANVPLKDLWVLLPFPILLFITHELYKYSKRRKSAKL